MMGSFLLPEAPEPGVGLCEGGGGRAEGEGWGWLGALQAALGGPTPLLGLGLKGLPGFTLKGLLLPPMPSGMA
jgi:hypothetical protein